VLRLDLAQVPFDVVEQVKPGLPGWRFAWMGFTPDTRHVRIRMVRAGTVRAGEPAFGDGVGLTSAEEFVPATSRGGKEWHNRKRPG
jgi:hypothetical protein